MAQLVSFQAGPYGFVRVGSEKSPTGWMDYLYLLVLGGRGAGKSQGGALRAMHYIVSWPDSLGIVVAPTMTMMHDSTLPTLQRVLNQAGLLEDREYTYNRTLETLTFWNGAVVLLRSSEHPQRLRGQDASWFWMDEPRDSPFEAFTNLAATLRRQNFPHQGWLTTTPLDKYHWIYPTFFPAEAAADGIDPVEFDEDFTDGTYLHFDAPTINNPFGGERLARNLARLYGKDSVMYKREVGGKIMLMEGLVYPTWDSEKYLVDPKLWPSKPIRVAAGQDFGFHAPAATVIEGVDKIGRRYILSEIYQSELSEDDLGDLLVKARKKYNILAHPCDWEDPRWMRTLKRKYHLPVVRASKKVGSAASPSSGIGLCTQALADSDTHGQMFFVDPKCVNFKREIENYTREEQRFRISPSEKPRKFNDHAMDAWRYTEMYIADHWHHPGQDPISTLLKTAPERVILKAQADLLAKMQELAHESDLADGISV